MFASALVVCSLLSQAESTVKLSEHPTIQWMHQSSTAIRAKVGHGEQPISEELCQAAMDQAQYIAQFRMTVTNVGGTLCYDNPHMDHFENGTPEIRATKRGFRQNVREILSLTVSGFNCWTNWCKSSGHYAAIVADEPLCGYGFATGPDGGTYWVALYGGSGPAVYATPIQSPRAQATNSYQPQLLRRSRRRW